jgi:hypothetical protein
MRHVHLTQLNLTVDYWVLQMSEYVFNLSMHWYVVCYSMVASYTQA